MEKTLYIAVCEDTQTDADQLLAALESCQIPVKCELFSGAEELLSVFRPDRYDLLISDIYMGGISGIQLVTRIRELDQNLPVAFITTSTDFALESYRLSALKYIEKPFHQKELEDLLKLACLERDSAPSLSVIHGGKEERFILSRILYLEQHAHQVEIHLRDGSCETVRGKLSQLLPQLEGHGFFQPHSSFAVSLSRVRSIDSELRCFVMQDGKNIPIRRESMSRARQALREHLFASTRGAQA